MDWIIIGLSSTNILLLLILIFKKPENHLEDDFKNTRLEINQTVNSTVNMLGNLLSHNIDQFSKQQSEKFDMLANGVNANIKQLTDLQTTSNLINEQKLENIRQSVEKSLNSSAQLTESKLENIRSSVVTSLNKLQDENTKKLDEIRNTVDEKLQKTLEDRITKSFNIVSERLKEVYEGLGEMQNLAVGVGDLKKVLSNVKTRGMLGEIQLGNILEQILSPEQYKTNVITKKGSKNPVEFAVILPGDDHQIMLPIDAKFPLEDYQKLLDAYETGNNELVKGALQNLVAKIKLFAKDIKEKYIDVPYTTDFGIMFLPVEGLYAEVVKSGICEILQRDYKIIIAGPTTMAALLNSLQMGFKTLAIQKRSSEVWQILGAVKTEFDNFGKVLEETQKKLTAANDDLDKLVGVRTRMIKSKLTKVTSLPELETKVLLPIEE